MHPASWPLGFLVFIALYAALAWLGFRWARWRLNRRARELAGALRQSGIRVVESRDTPSVRQAAEIDLEHDGRKAKVSVRQWGRDSQLISVTLPEPPMPYIWIRREYAVDRVAKAIGFEREVQIGAPEFDQAVYAATSASDEVVRRTLAGAETQRVIRDIVSRGFAVTLSPAGVSATAPKGIWSSFDASVIPTLIDRLAELAGVLPRPGAEAIGSARVPASTLAVLAPAFVSMFVPALLAASGLRDAVHAPIDNDAVARALLISLVPAAAAVVFAARRLRTRPVAMLEVPVVSVALLASVTFTSAFALFFINTRFDPSPPTQHRARVVEYYKGNHHTVYVAPWDDSGARRKVIVPSSIAVVHIGDALDIDSHPGALGWTWVSRIEPTP